MKAANPAEKVNECCKASFAIPMRNRFRRNRCRRIPAFDKHQLHPAKFKAIIGLPQQKLQMSGVPPEVPDWLDMFRS
ncbi:MAG: hypothetical protein OXC26_00660 [Albidovulum sp.]|nr:hypothetical protein [Albidovulum sp.]